MRGQVTAKDASVDRRIFERDRPIAELNDDVADSNWQVQLLDHHDSPMRQSLVSDTKCQSVYQPSDWPDIHVQILGRTWTLDSLRTPTYNSSAPSIFFYWAANNGDVEAARFIYDTTSVDEKYTDPKTNMNALQVASKQDFPSVVETLLSLGLTSGHHQALQIAVHKGHLKIVRMLRLFGARLLQLPMSAVQNGYEEIVEVLIEDNVDIADPGLLECAVLNRHDGIVKALSSKDCSLPKSNSKRERSLGHNKTPLEKAAFTGDTASLHVSLITLPSQPINIFLNSLYYAICSSHGQCLEILLDYAVHELDGSIDIYVLIRKPMDLALRIGNHDMTFILMAYLSPSEGTRSIPPDLTDITQSELALQRSPIPNSSPELRTKPNPSRLGIIITREFEVY